MKRQKENTKASENMFFFRISPAFAKGKKVFFGFSSKFKTFGLFQWTQTVVSSEKCENVEKDMLETKTVCSFEIFKKRKQNNASVLLFSVLHLGEVNQNY